MAEMTVSMRCVPPEPLVEVSEGAQLLHIDFALTNETTSVLELWDVAVVVVDRGEVIFRRHIDHNGLPSGISTIPEFPVEPGQSVTIFNPLERFPGDLPLTSVRYEFLFSTDDGSKQWREQVELMPLAAPVDPDLVLPLRGRLLVYEAHDYYGHHRRLDTQHPVIRGLGLGHNSGRFSYDLSLVDRHGRMYQGSGTRNEDWYSWDQPVLAAGTGVVVACAGDRPDFDIDGVGYRLPVGRLADPSVFLGNYVTMQHGDDVYSMTGHCRKGSVLVKRGDRVSAGDEIGRVGLSGSCLTVHTHFQLQSGVSFDSEGIPAHFTNFRRLRGANSVDVREGAIDSGEVIQSLA